ncbi:hypothetical protein LINGRAHAP2_LOCUS34829 [Linum grandiflorum]
MVSPTPSPLASASPSPSWASVVADSSRDLKFVEIPPDAVVDGILKIPKSVVAAGLMKMKAGLVAQFLGDVPPLRVLGSMAQRLWGHEGFVTVSLISEGFFLLEFPSVRLCDWVLSRSWHIHHSALLLRRWVPQIRPIALSPTEIPVWVVFKMVPPHLITLEGIGWLASMIGTPVQRYVRDGCDVKVCIVCKATDVCPAKLSVEMEGEDVIDIEIEVPSVRVYGKKAKDRRWVAKATEPSVLQEVDPGVGGALPRSEETVTGPEVDTLPVLNPGVLVEQSEVHAIPPGSVLDSPGVRATLEGAPIPPQLGGGSIAASFRSPGATKSDVESIPPQLGGGSIDVHLRSPSDIGKQVDEEAPHKPSPKATFGDYFIQGTRVPPIGAKPRKNTRRR